MTFTYEYPHPAVTADIIIVSSQRTPHILLIQRKYQPFAQMWALPGGFLNPDETLEQTAERELKEETGLNITSLEQFKTFSTPERDPRGWTISTVFYKAIPNKDNIQVQAADDAASAHWFPLNNLPTLAFDHSLILKEFATFYTMHKHHKKT